MSDIQSMAQGGREASLARRRALSQGKAALPPSGERTREAKRTAPTGETAPVAVVAPPAPASEPAAAGGDCGHPSCRQAARARRADLSRRGRGDAPPAPPSRPSRQGSIDYPPKVVASPTQGGQVVTGVRLGPAAQVTGAARGLNLPISGSQYIGPDAGAGWRAGGLKVGLSRTGAGNVVSGTLVRGRAPITGDEAGGARVTGEADQTPDDDLTPRQTSPQGSAQFQRQADPHGATVFGTNLGRSARAVGSRDRTRAPALEITESGLSITGSAVGRSIRVTGDEDGACRAVTGSQYLTPARRSVDCFGPQPTIAGHDRRDPVTGGKVRQSQTHGGLTVTGADLEHDPRVTGQEPGACAVITGSPYQGALRRWCDPAVADEGDARLARRPMAARVTGDTPLVVDRVTGAGRGVARAITGTPYQAADRAPPALPESPVGALDAGFSVRSPQRDAHLSARPGAAGAGRITGAFAVGEGKVTGAVEFLFRSRGGGPDKAPARDRVTGEGRHGRTITGDSWADQSNVTGVDGAFAADRNPSLSAGVREPFAGARTFKAEPPKEEPKSLVTGMFGFSSKASARVTLSGGAQG